MCCGDESHCHQDYWLRRRHYASYEFQRRHYKYSGMGGGYLLGHFAIYLITVGECDALITLVKNEKVEKLKLSAGWSGILATDGVELEISTGTVTVTDFGYEKLVKIQVFLDLSIPLIGESGPSCCWCYFAFDTNSLKASPPDIENWFVSQYVSGYSEIAKISALLRKTETYGLISYLFDNSQSSQTLQELAHIYGLSTTHFRRLSRKALGKSAKTTLNDWRLVRSVISMLESDEQNMTDVALEHGFSSLSHFSNSVKDSLGLSPRMLKKAITKSIENET